jgi:hypothetical protein
LITHPKLKVILLSKFSKPGDYNKIKEPSNIVLDTMQRPAPIFCSVKASMVIK